MRIRKLMCVYVCLLLAQPWVAQGEVKAPDAQKLQQILKDFDSYAEQARIAWRVPGMSIAIVSNDKVIYSKGFGVKKEGGNDPVDTHTVFPIGSATKAFTSALVAMMADENKLKWTDPVLQHLPNFEMFDPWVTRQFQVQDLMAQHSGMPPYATDWAAMAGFPLTYLGQQMRYVQPAYSFRQGFSYVNDLFITASEIVGQKTGKTWQQNVQERIFTPLGMSDSSTMAAGYRAAKDVTFVHKLQNGKVVAREMNDPLLNWTDNLAPAGAVNSTVLDMTNWIRFQLGGTIDGTPPIQKANLDFLHKPQTVLPRPPDTVNTPLSNAYSFYCQGWVLTEARPYPIVWHNGDTMFVHAVVGLVQEANVGIVVLSNLGNTELPESLMFKFYDLYFGNPNFDWSAQTLHKAQAALEGAIAAVGKRPATADAPMTNSAYTGVFHNQVYGTFTVAQAEGGLTVTSDQAGIVMKLVPWNRDTFILSWPHSDGFLGDSGFVRFVIDQSGTASSFVGDQFADVDGGRFTRVGK